MILVFGLKICDRCRDARKFMDDLGLAYQFHDLHADGLSPETLDKWMDRLGWESLLNRRGTTWRHLDKEEKSDLDRASAKALLLKYPAIIKRPVFEIGNEVFIGFEQPHRDYLSKLA